MQKVLEIEEGAGLALKIQEQLMGIPISFNDELNDLSFDELKEMAWEDCGAFDD